MVRDPNPARTRSLTRVRVEWTATPAAVGRQGGASGNDGGTAHRQDWDENLVSREVGQHTNGLDESGRSSLGTQPRCGGGNAGNASRGSSVSTGTGGRTPSTNLNQLGNTTCIGQRRNALTHDVQAGHLATTIEPLQHDARDSQSALLRGNDIVVFSANDPHWHLKDPTQTHQDVMIMCCCEAQSQIGPNRSQPIVGPGGRAKEQQEPNRLHVNAPEVCVPRTSGVASPNSSTSP